jgi:UDP-3-O-[3-hydroxymyristoyl] glucosamine N-acyltransferase
LGWNVETLIEESEIQSYEIWKNYSPVIINSVAPLSKAFSKDLSFCVSQGDKAIRDISSSGAGVILCNNDVKHLLSNIKERKYLQCLVFLDNPRLAIMRIIKLIYKQKKSESHGVSQSAIIDKTVEMGKNCSIGEFCFIGENCKIGDNTTIHDRVSISQNTIIGRNCDIQPGVVIGADGFSYERHIGTLELERFPHIGGVQIGDNVEICSNCSIARGSISDTIIGNGTKINALVHIAHNVEIGKNCAISAGVIVGGSTIIGDTCWIGQNSTLKHKIKIGNQVIVASGATVVNNVGDEDIVGGIPAKSIKYKVTCNKLFLMGGHSYKPKSGDNLIHKQFNELL